MPPKPKYTRSEIIQSAIHIIKNGGFEKLTARSLAEALQSSTKPIFIAFKNMDEVAEECRNYVEFFYDSFNPQIPESSFYSAEKYVIFAKKEPFLFRFRYLEEKNTAANFTDLMKKLDSNYDENIKVVQKNSGTPSFEAAEKLYKSIWLFAHGIATLCAFNQCSFEYEEIHSLISEFATSLAIFLQNEK